ncbi:hypothetical protein ACHAXR_008547 [Thalassiosira sp. AJA248-18]
MFSSAARRLVIANATRQSAAHSQCRRLPASSKRCFVALTQKSQPPQNNDGSVQPFIISSPCLRTATQIPTQRRWLSAGEELPYHIVVGMPALSPTMESGTISKWNVAEGESFSAGDSLAVIETDKATIDFEAQDDGVMAKHLVEAGGNELNVGVAIMVTVEETDDVAAFANFTPDAAASGGGEAAAPAAAAETPAAPAAPAAAPAEDLPYHIVVGMPALSPTMDAGTISKWNIAEGESFSAGDSIGVIETDKATIDFEAQDDGVVAKYLVEPGSGEVAVGVPIMVTVEEEGDVAAFKDFVAGSAPDSSATEASAPAPVVEEVKAESVAAAAAPAPTPAAAAAPTPAAAAPAAVAAPAAPLDAISLGGSTWGRLAAEKSPLAKALASKQKQYIEKYGSTGHIPIV